MVHGRWQPKNKTSIRYEAIRKPYILINFGDFYNNIYYFFYLYER